MKDVVVWIEKEREKELSAKKITKRKKSGKGNEKRGYIIVLGGYTPDNEKILKKLVEELQKNFLDKTVEVLDYLKDFTEYCQKTNKNFFEVGRKNIAAIIKKLIELMDQLEDKVNWKKTIIIGWSFGALAFLVAVGWAIIMKKAKKWLNPQVCLFTCFPWGKNSINFNDLEKRALKEGDPGLNKLDSKEFYEDLTKVIIKLLKSGVKLTLLLPRYNESTESFNDGRLHIPVIAINDLIKKLTENDDESHLVIIEEVWEPGHRIAVGMVREGLLEEEKIEEERKAKKNIQQIIELIRQMIK